MVLFDLFFTVTKVADMSQLLNTPFPNGGVSSKRAADVERLIRYVDHAATVHAPVQLVCIDPRATGHLPSSRHISFLDIAH